LGQLDNGKVIEAMRVEVIDGGGGLVEVGSRTIVPV
jgi:hypothetical protein